MGIFSSISGWLSSGNTLNREQFIRSQRRVESKSLDMVRKDYKLLFNFFEEEIKQASEIIERSEPWVNDHILEHASAQLDVATAGLEELRSLGSTLTVWESEHLVRQYRDDLGRAVADIEGWVMEEPEERRELGHQTARAIDSMTGWRYYPTRFVNNWNIARENVAVLFGSTTRWDLNNLSEKEQQLFYDLDADRQFGPTTPEPALFREPGMDVLIAPDLPLEDAQVPRRRADVAALGVDVEASAAVVDIDVKIAEAKKSKAETLHRFLANRAGPEQSLEESGMVDLTQSPDVEIYSPEIGGLELSIDF